MAEQETPLNNDASAGEDIVSEDIVSETAGEEPHDDGEATAGGADAVGGSAGSQEDSRPPDVPPTSGEPLEPGGGKPSRSRIKTAGIVVGTFVACAAVIVGTVWAVSAIVDDRDDHAQVSFLYSAVPEGEADRDGGGDHWRSERYGKAPGHKAPCHEWRGRAHRDRWRFRHMPWFGGEWPEGMPWFGGDERPFDLGDLMPWFGGEWPDSGEWPDDWAWPGDERPFDAQEDPLDRGQGPDDEAGTTEPGFSFRDDGDGSGGVCFGSGDTALCFDVGEQLSGEDMRRLEALMGLLERFGLEELLEDLLGNGELLDLLEDLPDGGSRLFG